MPQTVAKTQLTKRDVPDDEFKATRQALRSSRTFEHAVPYLAPVQRGRLLRMILERTNPDMQEQNSTVICDLLLADAGLLQCAPTGINRTQLKNAVDLVIEHHSTTPHAKLTPAKRKKVRA